MGRIPGAERFRPYTKWMLLVLVVCWIIWGTPNTLIASRDEFASMGGSHHPFLSILGVMSAKNTAVNFMILTTFLSFLMYRRANRLPTVSWAKAGTMAQGAMFVLSGATVLFYGIYGYFVEAIVRIGFSVYQVAAVLTCIIGVTVIDIMLLRGSESRGEIQWGKMPNRSQYALFVLAVTFTWLMGLMGYIRSGIRQHWHVTDVFRDNSIDAFTPTLGYAANIVSIGTIMFMVMVIFVFWLSQVSTRKTVLSGYWVQQAA
jgi:cytochrome d ubiquinol oxidase subunit I